MNWLLSALAVPTTPRHWAGRAKRQTMTARILAQRSGEATLSQRGINPLHDDVVDFAALVTGRLP
jgi:hypothetical protein